MINGRRQTRRYVLGDYLASNVAWFLFNIVRFHFPGIVAGGSVEGEPLSLRGGGGEIFFPLVVVGGFFFSGCYQPPFF